MELRKVCIVCGEEKDIKKFDFGYCKNRRNICEMCRNKRKRIALWLSFLKAFDWKCQCCGEDDIRFLTLDHVQNDGFACSQDNITELRRAKELKYDRNIFNCTCWNCNCARAKNKGVCPHKDISKEEFLARYKKSGEILGREKLKRGRIQIYEGDLRERNRKAQAVFKRKKELEELAKKLFKQGITAETLPDKIPPQ